MNFRYYAMEEAKRVGVTGRVWNRDDGAVGVIAEGEHDALGRLEQWLRRGPRLAQVSEVEVEHLGGEGRFREFAIADDEPA